MGETKAEFKNYLPQIRAPSASCPRRSGTRQQRRLGLASHPTRPLTVQFDLILRHAWKECLQVSVIYQCLPLPWTSTSHFLKTFKFNFLLVALGLCCCTWAFSSCGEQGLRLVVVHGLLIAVVSRVEEHGLWGTQASVAVMHGLSCSKACGIFLEQGLNACPLHWQADS